MFYSVQWYISINDLTFASLPVGFLSFSSSVRVASMLANGGNYIQCTCSFRMKIPLVLYVLISTAISQINIYITAKKAV